jgi:hypothetical protein
MKSEVKGAATSKMLGNTGLGYYLEVRFETGCGSLPTINRPKLKKISSRPINKILVSDLKHDLGPGWTR